MRWFESVFQKGVSVGFFRKKAEIVQYTAQLFRDRCKKCQLVWRRSLSPVFRETIGIELVDLGEFWVDKGVKW